MFSSVVKMEVIDVEMNNSQIEAIVKQVLSSLSAPAASASTGSKCTGIPKTAHVAMLTGIEKVEVKEYPMPEVGDDDILLSQHIDGLLHEVHRT